MTKDERDNPQVINGSRRSRIARGSGSSVEQVNLLLKQFSQMKKMMKKFSGPGAKALKGMHSLGGLMGGGKFPR